MIKISYRSVSLFLFCSLF